MEIEHAGRYYAFASLAEFVADSLRASQEAGHCTPPGAVKKVAKALGLKPKQVQSALDAAGVHRQLTDAEMVGRVSFMGETIVRFHRRSIDSKGSYGHVYEVSFPEDAEKHYDFVHDIDRTTHWYHLPDSPEAAQAVADCIVRRREAKEAEKRDEERRARAKAALEGMPDAIGLELFYRGMVVLKGITEHGALYDEAQRRLEGIARLGDPYPIIGCNAVFVDDPS